MLALSRASANYFQPLSGRRSLKAQAHVSNERAGHQLGFLLTT
jgi:hypothetical protein